jgi:glycosyltransferase involved in cell wall biosynthesis
MLARLLTGISEIEIPKWLNLATVVIDNDEDQSAANIVLKNPVRTGETIYVCEPRRGIPVARNRALEEAERLGSKLLIFIDDDELPDKNWLVELIECWQRTGANLIGGPVYVVHGQGDGGWQKFVAWSLAGRARQKARKTAAAAARGGRYTIVTNNWLCDLDWQRSTGIRFDERYLMTGGSDTVFFRSAIAAGCKVAWCPNAIVYEEFTPDRLSMRYHFWRSAYQSMNHFQIKYPRPRLLTWVTSLASATLRATAGLVLLFVPVMGSASPVSAVRSLGWAAGRTMAMFDRKSRLYE